MSRLSIELPAHQHQQIKAEAALRGMTIKDYIVKQTIVTSKKNDEEKALDELMALLAPRIASARKGKVSTLSMDAIIKKAKARRRG